jgi:hypothetical protein
VREKGHLKVLDVDGDNIKMDIQELGWGRMDLVAVALDGAGDGLL